MDAGLILIVVVGALILWAFAMTFVYESRVDRLLAQANAEEEKRQQAAKTGRTYSMPLPEIPIEPVEYNLVQDTAHLPTWTPTVSHFPDQDHGPETTSQHDYDAISDHGSYDDGCACDGGCDGGDD